MDRHAPTAQRSARPFLRWAGSKRKQLGRLKEFWSKDHKAYVEPFAGSACLFFALAPKRATLGDSNKELVELYEVVRDHPRKLHRRLRHIPRDNGTYLRWRSLKSAALDRETRAVRFLYLNRNCFNGIYRTNLDGDFNVPMGTKLSPYVTEADLVLCSELLQNVQLVSGDFEETLASVGQGSFVYLDPPFAVNSRRIFREYGTVAFNVGDIERLSDSLIEIVRAKADFLVSYADCRESRQLAANWNSIRLPVRRNIAGFADARRNAYEWLITNRPIKSTSDSAWHN